MVAVAYRRWSFARGSNFKALTGKVLVFGYESLVGGDRLREVVAQEGPTATAFPELSLLLKDRTLVVAGHVAPKIWEPKLREGKKSK